MPELTSWISAVILAYWLSRLTLRLPLPLRSVPRVVIAHLVSGLVLFLFVGWVKSYFTLFAEDQAMVVLFAQPLWLAIDLGVTGARHLAGEGAH